VKRSLASLMLLLVSLFMAGQAVASAQPGTLPLTALDGELLTKVKLAGNWEIPSGQMAQERSSDPKVQEVGRTLVSDHTMLDTAVEELAARYGHSLPPAPNDSQKSWLTEMANSTGKQFDAVWAMRLRSAHGMIFPLIAQVRAETEDPEIRKFATTANTIVMKHMTILESTNNVDYAALADPTPLMVPSDSEGTGIIIAVALLPLLVGLAVGLLWFASRNRRHRYQPPSPRQDDDDDDDNNNNSGRGSQHRRDEGRRNRLFVDKELSR
jgi:predicted outer membrane protein